MTYPNYKECCARWEKVRKEMDLNALINAIKPGPCVYEEVRQLRCDNVLLGSYVSDYESRYWPPEAE